MANLVRSDPARDHPTPEDPGAVSAGFLGGFPSKPRAILGGGLVLPTILLLVDYGQPNIANFETLLVGSHII